MTPWYVDVVFFAAVLLVFCAFGALWELTDDLLSRRAAPAAPPRDNGGRPRIASPERRVDGRGDAAGGARYEHDSTADNWGAW